MWTLVSLIMGLMIPYTMLKNYETPIPGVGYSFPQMVVAQGAYVQDLFMSDAATVIPLALHKASTRIKANTKTAWDNADVWDFIMGRAHEVIVGLVGTFVQILLFLLFLALWAILMAHVMWAQIAIAILIMLGPMLLVWLMFEPHGVSVLGVVQGPSSATRSMALSPGPSCVYSWASAPATLRHWAIPPSPGIQSLTSLCGQFPQPCFASPAFWPPSRSASFAP